MIVMENEGSWFAKPSWETPMRNATGLAAFLWLGLTPLALAWEDAETRYRTLLNAAREDPSRADFRALRAAFAKTASYDPHARPGFDVGPVELELQNGERAAALFALDRILEGRWMDLRAHLYAIEVCQRLDDSSRSRLHQAFQRGIADAILGAGDGRSFPSAWPVLTLDEEAMVLESLDLNGGKPIFVEHDGHAYHIYEFKDESLRRDLKLYFNVDLFRSSRRSRREAE